MEKTLSTMLSDIEMKILKKNPTELFARNDETLARSADYIKKILNRVSDTMKDNGLSEYVRLLWQTRTEATSVQSAIRCNVKGFGMLQINLIANHPSRPDSPLFTGKIVWDMKIVDKYGHVQDCPMRYQSGDEYKDIIALIHNYINSHDV